MGGGGPSDAGTYIYIYIFMYVFPPWNDHISHLWKKKIIDSKVPAGTKGYVSSLEGTHIYS